MRRAIPVVLAAALASPVGLNVPLDAQEARLDRLVQSRSLEQPLPSARRIPLPSDNPLELLPVFGHVYMLAGGPSNVAIQVGDDFCRSCGKAVSSSAPARCANRPSR